MPPFDNRSRNILTVTKLNRLARTILESEIGLVWLSAEVSNFVAASSGHWYFTLKDNKAQVRAAMFKNANRSVRVRPKEGDRILVRASVGLYEPRGDYQLIVEHLESDGEGQLKLAYEALKQTLMAEGLFDAQNKKPLPHTIQKVGIITSASGAAIHDALTVFKRRSPATQIVIYPAMVQGELAAGQLINALNKANMRNEVDVVLLTRGGGSLEDLWCFNDEQLARCIAASAIPVVSAVGHEVDMTIADFVADLRAPTPSAGAELLSRDQSALRQQLAQQVSQLNRSWLGYQQVVRHRLDALKHQLQGLHPSNRIHSQSQSLDRLTLSLTHGMQHMLSTGEQAQERLTNRLYSQSPERKLTQLKERTEALAERRDRAALLFLAGARQSVAHSAQQLQAVSPLATIARGYSIQYLGDKPVTSVEQVATGDTLRSKMKDGEIISHIKQIVRTGAQK